MRGFRQKLSDSFDKAYNYFAQTTLVQTMKICKTPKYIVDCLPVRWVDSSTYLLEVQQQSVAMAMFSILHRKRLVRWDCYVSCFVTSNTLAPFVQFFELLINWWRRLVRETEKQHEKKISFNCTCRWLRVPAKNCRLHSAFSKILGPLLASPVEGQQLQQEDNKRRKRKSTKISLFFICVHAQAKT